MKFEILWYNGGPKCAPNRTIGRTFVTRPDLTAAIIAACNMMKAGRDGSKSAHGFYVRESK